MVAKNTASRKEPTGMLGEPAVAITVMGVPKTRSNKAGLKKVADAVAAGVKPLLNNIQVDVSDNAAIIVYPDEKEKTAKAYEHKPRVSAKKQKDEVKAVIDIAESWNTREDVSPAERCHGVAHDVYVVVGDGNSSEKLYSKHYNELFSEKIEKRIIRAAEELFGGKPVP